MNLKIIIFFLLNVLYDARADVPLHNNEICVVGYAYLPPVTNKQPHVIKTEVIDIILWSNIAHKLELLPWDLVCKKMCFDIDKIKSTAHVKEFVINNSKDVRIDWAHNCK